MLTYTRTALRGHARKEKTKIRVEEDIDRV